MCAVLFFYTFLCIFCPSFMFHLLAVPFPTLIIFRIQVRGDSVSAFPSHILYIFSMYISRGQGGTKKKIARNKKSHEGVKSSSRQKESPKYILVLGQIIHFLPLLTPFQISPQSALRTGRNLVASGYALYGSATMMVVSINNVSTRAGDTNLVFAKKSYL